MRQRHAWLGSRVCLQTPANRAASFLACSSSYLCGAAKRIDSSMTPTMPAFAPSLPGTYLLPFQRNIPDRDVRPQFVFAVAVVFQGLAEEACADVSGAGVYVADAGAGAHQVVGCTAERNPDVAHAQLKILVALDVLDPEVADLLMHLKIGVLRHLEFHIELRGAAVRRRR